MKNLDNDLFIMQNQEVLADWWEVHDKLWEMDYRDGKLKEIDNDFELDFN